MMSDRKSQCLATEERISGVITALRGRQEDTVIVCDEVFLLI